MFSSTTDKIVLVAAIVLFIALLVLVIFRGKINDFFNRNNEAYMKKQGKKQTAAGKKFITEFLAANPQLTEDMIFDTTKRIAECIVHNLPTTGINPQVISKIRTNWQFHCIQSMTYEDMTPFACENELLTVFANYSDESSTLCLKMTLGMFNGMLTLYDCDLVDATAKL